MLLEACLYKDYSKVKAIRGGFLIKKRMLKANLYNLYILLR